MAYSSNQVSIACVWKLLGMLLVGGLAACTHPQMSGEFSTREATSDTGYCAVYGEQAHNGEQTLVLRVRELQRENTPGSSDVDDPQAEDSGHAPRRPVYEPLRQEDPVSTQMGYLDCSGYDQQSEYEINPEVLRSEELLRVDGTIDMNLPLQQWLNHSAGFNTGALMESLYQLLRKMEELLAEMTRGSTG